MSNFIQAFFLFCVVQLTVCAKQFDTFYGPIEVEEPVLIELIESPAFQRLESIHQYGVAYYTTHREEYTRYAHSLGVFFILKEKGASLKEQIAGLLHDVSHTVFSHVGDWIFARENEVEDYQNSIHLKYLEESGLSEILNRHGFLANELLPREEFFPALEQNSPNLSADRIDYNIQGAYYQNFITYEEAIEILNDLIFLEGKWVAANKTLMEKLVRYSLFMTLNCWGSATNYLSSRQLADAILRAVEIGCLTMDEIHFGTDQIVWGKLNNCQDADIQKKMAQLMHIENSFYLVNMHNADLLVKSKFRGIDPWIMHEGAISRLTALDPAISEEYRVAKEIIQRGWAIKFLERG